MDANLVGRHFDVAAKARSARRCDPSGFGPAGTGIQRKGLRPPPLRFGAMRAPSPYGSGFRTAVTGSR